VEVVGQLVGLGADERGFHPVHGPVEGLQGNGPQAVGKDFLQFRVEVLPEGQAPGDQVLPCAGLGLVHSRAGSLRQEGPLQGGIHPLLVQGVPRLVGGGEETVGEVSFVDPGGDAHVAHGKPRLEGMVGQVLPSPGEIVAERPNDHLPEVELPVFGEMPLQARVVGRLPGSGCPHQRHELFPQLPEDPPDGPCLHAIVGEVDEGVCDVLISREKVRQAAAEVQGLLQQGKDPLEIVGGAGLRPHLVGKGGMLRESRQEIRRHPDCLPVFPVSRPDQAAVVRIGRKAPRVGEQLVDQPAYLRGGELLLGDPGEGAHLAPPGLRPAGRHVRGLVPGKHRPGIVQVVHFTEPCFQLLQLFLHGSHEGSLPTLPPGEPGRPGGCLCWPPGTGFRLREGASPTGGLREPGTPAAGKPASDQGGGYPGR